VASHSASTIHDLLQSRASLGGDAIALLDTNGNRWTYTDLHSEVGRVVHALREADVSPSDRIVTLLPEGIEAAIGFLAVTSYATAVPLNPGLGIRDLEFYLGDLRPKAVLTQRGFKTESLSAVSTENTPIIEIPAFGASTSKASDASSASRLNPPKPEDVGLILYTSGTTSRPKRVPLSQQQLVASAGNIAQTLSLVPRDRCLNVMPLFHIHGLMAGLLASMHVGASVICAPRFNSSRILHWLTTYSPTWYTAVPTIHQSLLGVLDEQGMATLTPNPLRVVRSSSSAMPLRVIEELEQRLGVPVIEAYGMTEATHQIASNPLPPKRRKPGSVGLPVGVEVAILDPAGATLPTDAIGEVALRGPTVTTGYESNPEANTAAFDQGWFRAGDEGRLDGDGYLFLTGRVKEMINRGGEKIAPVDIDNALMEHPAVAQAVAFALPHKSLGEDVAAAVVAHPSTVVTEGELRTHLLERIAEFKVPSRIVFVDAIPKGATGKLQRIGLADKLQDVLTVEYVPPQTPFEQKLSDIWKEVLVAERIGRDDNFFFVGGDSLSATRVITRVNKHFGVRIGIRQLFDAPTLKEQAKVLLGLVLDQSNDA